MPISDLFSLYRQDAASFLGMLHHAAHHLAKAKFNMSETPQVIYYKCETLHMVRQRLSSSNGPYDDGTIITVGLLANAEVFAHAGAEVDRD